MFLFAIGGLAVVALLGLSGGGADAGQPVSDWVRRVIERVSASEGRPDSLNRNLDGNGLSFGVIQWTQRSGNLGVLLAAMRDADPDAFTQIFGSSASLLDVARRGSLAAVDGAALWEEPWASRFVAAGRYAPFVAVQWQVAAQGDHFRGALAVASLLGVRTERAMALFFDRSVHQGPRTAVKLAEQLRRFYVEKGITAVAYRDVLEAYAWLAARRFHRTTAPESEQYSVGSPHILWRPVGQEWHAIAGPWDLYAAVSQRTRKILDDPKLSDTEMRALPPENT